MQRRPITLIVLALFLACVALSLPAQIMLIYGHSLDELGAVAGKLTVLNWLVMAGCLTCAGLIANASPHSRRAMALLTGVVALNNFFVGYYATDFSPAVAAFATFTFGLLNAPLWSKPMRELMKHPDRRWWLRSPRHRLSIPVLINSARKIPVRAESFDLSETGLFIPVGDTHLQVDDRITLRLSFGTFARVRCEGRVVRRANAKGTYPAGVGVEFTGLDWRQKRALRRHLREYSI